jgi:hypothetical protein
LFAHKMVCIQVHMNQFSTDESEEKDHQITLEDLTGLVSNLGCYFIIFNYKLTYRGVKGYLLFGLSDI